MAPNSLSPASAVLAYTTEFSSHRMTIPTTAWFPTSITGNLGSYLDHDGDPIDAEQMWIDFAALIVKFMKTTTHFDSVTVYTMADSTSPNIPRASVALADVGEVGGTSLSQAQSATFNFKTGFNGNFKIVLLDQPNNGLAGFNAQHPADFNADVLALEAFVCGRDTAIVGRDDSIPSVLRKITYDLNDALQKEYKMSA